MSFNDNAPLCTASSTIKLINSFKWQLLSHPRYNPDLVSYDFYCPPPFRRKARGHSIRLCVVRGAWFRVYSRYLVSATPPTVFNQSFWNFTGVFIIVWRCACAFYRILKLFLFTFFRIFNLDFFCIVMRGSRFIVGTLWVQLLLQFLTNPSEILQVSSSWFEDVHVFFKVSLNYFFHFFHIFNLRLFFLHGSEFVVGTLWAQLLLQFNVDSSETSHLS